VQKKACEKRKERLFSDCCEICERRVKYNEKAEASELIYKFWKDLSVDDSMWITHTGFSLKYFEQQSEISEYIIASDKYKTNKADLTIVIYGHNNSDSFKIITDKIIKLRDNVEIICVNDGSSDDTSVILEKLSAEDDRVVVVNQKHIGVSASKNKAMNISNGKYICFLDAADDIAVSVLEKNAAVIKENNTEIILFNSYTDDDFVTGYSILVNLFNKNWASNIRGQYIINKDYIDNLNLKFNEYITESDALFMIIALINSDTVKTVNEVFVYDSDNRKISQINKFIDSFIVCNLLNSIVLTESYHTSESTEVLPSYVKMYDNICKNVYSKLSYSEIISLNKKLPDHYLYSFYNFRDMEEIKKSKSYKISQALIHSFEKVIKIFR